MFNVFLTDEFIHVCRLNWQDSVIITYKDVLYSGDIGSGFRIWDVQ